MLDPLGPASSPSCWGDHSSTEKHQMKLGGDRCKSGRAGLPGKLEKPQLELEKGVQVSYVDMSPVPSRLALTGARPHRAPSFQIFVSSKNVSSSSTQTVVRMSSRAMEMGRVIRRVSYRHLSD